VIQSSHPDTCTTIDPQKHNEAKGQGGIHTQGIEHTILEQKLVDKEPITMPSDGADYPIKYNEELGKIQQEKQMRQEQSTEHRNEQ